MEGFEERLRHQENSWARAWRGSSVSQMQLEGEELAPPPRQAPGEGVPLDRWTPPLGNLEISADPAAKILTETFGQAH